MTAYAAAMDQARRHSQSDCGSSTMSEMLLGHAVLACPLLFVLLVLVGLGALALLGLVVVSIILVRVLADLNSTPAGNKA